jgi:hypothetical protein
MYSDQTIRIDEEKCAGLENFEAIGEKIWIFSCWAEVVKYNKTNLLS